MEVKSFSVVTTFIVFLLLPNLSLINSLDNDGQPLGNAEADPDAVRRNDGPFKIQNKPDLNKNANAPKIRDVNNAGQKQESPAKIRNSSGLSGPKRIAEDADCTEDIKKFCPGTTGSNMQILDCMQTNLKDGDEISAKCQHVLWTYMKELTSDLRFESASQEICVNALDQFPECKELEKNHGLVVSCLIEYIDQIQDVPCKRFLGKLEPIVFSDYRLVYKLVENCNESIQQLHCGRLAKPGQLPHGEVVSCLAAKADALPDACRHEILRVAELQSDDYAKDKQLYFACRQDRERFCKGVQSGEGNVYRCLFRHKLHPDMSEQCREQLTVRQKLQRDNYKVNHGLAINCKAEIKTHNCLADQSLLGGGARGKETKLSIILLCLEAAHSSGSDLSPECVSDLKEVRRSLMEDYQLTPEIIKDCSNEIKDCSKNMRPSAQTTHCLMDKARRQGKSRSDTLISLQCLNAMRGLMKEVNIRENIDVDSVLEETCGTVIDSKCSHVQPGQGKVIDCLMNYINKPRIMNAGCREKLMEVQYFVSRDFTLSVGFLKACEKEMKSACPVSTTEDFNPSKQSAVLFCLYRKGKARDKLNQISVKCLEETRRVMIDRAHSVDLDPEVEEACMEDLASLCSEKTDKHDEMDCLEDNLDSLKSDECRKVVDRFIDEDEEEAELNDIIMDECEPVINEHCKDVIEKGKDKDEDDDKNDDNDDDDEDYNNLMQCLIKHKSDDKMNKKCRAQVNHHQLITMKDWHLSFEFKEACKNAVKDHCDPSMKTKSSVVICLSTLVRNDTLADKGQHRVNKQCRRQLNFELLQMSENIDLDADLKAGCQADVEQYCSEEKHGRSQVINCLRANQKNLNPTCHKLVFQREVAEANDPRTDHLLMTRCKSMIKKYCLYTSDVIRSPAAMFDCLVQHKQEEAFNTDCLKVIVLRQRQRSIDVRLNPQLWSSCQTDIQQFCPQYLNPSSPTEMEGKVLYCLRNIFSIQAGQAIQQKPLRMDNVKRMTPKCSDHIQSLIKESVQDYMQDKRLAEKCQTQIERYCLQETLRDFNKMGDNGAVVECLRKNIKQVVESKDNACFLELVRVTAESRADVHIDPILYRACHIDIEHNCKDVLRGEGRQMSCLLDIHSDTPNRLSDECKRELTQRIELWDKASKGRAPETLLGLAQQVNDSPSRHYLFMVIFAIITSLLLIGILCGRVTKRVARQVKNR